MNLRFPVLNASLAALLTFGVSAPDSATAQATASRPAATTEPKVITWDELMPKDWDPMKRFREQKLGIFSDDDPRAKQLMREMREAWDNAPTNRQIDGSAVKLPGYVVPLEEARGELKEFLLVPYYGACLHTPPPPANQIVHVVAAKPQKGLHTMDAVWISGTLQARRQDSDMGTSGYQMRGALVERYVAPPAKP